MIVTSLSALAVSVRSTLAWGRSNTATSAPSASPARHATVPPIDSVELSQQAAAEARTADPSVRAETLLKTIDADGDGVVSKTEFTTGAVEVLKPAAVRFHHEYVVSRAIREYAVADIPKRLPEV